MRIARIETFLIPPRYLFCRIETDSGIVGWGEPVVEGRAEVVRTAVEQLAEYLLGADPLRIEDHWQVLTRGGFYRGGPVLSSAVAGIDQALWDIAGKHFGVPVHRLLGGPVRDRVRMYSWVHGADASELRDSAARAVEAGFTAVKMGGSGRSPVVPAPADVDAVLAKVAAVREVVGDERGLAIDFHGRMSYAASRVLLPALAPMGPLFVEEPLLPEHAMHLRSIVESAPVPIATGERLFSRTDFLPALQAGVAVAQPDLSHAGGISEVRRIAAFAETFGAFLAPHCPLGPIALAASLQVDLATPNFLIQEQSLGIGYDRAGQAGPLGYVVDTAPFEIEEGHACRTDRPGLGVDLDESAVRKADGSERGWRVPRWRHDDGSHAEW
ncbi:galactonate dehydratase [Nonomuraea sp. MTCD27]|uniref:galactonate dehydratase n=1 Tax=Nonomuraea sp. MTCD27 TaxID=1676747 RepID=UPI0035C24E83